MERTASSGTARIPSNRAWACARFPARRPASPIPRTSTRTRCSPPPAPRAPSPATAAASRRWRWRRCARRCCIPLDPVDALDNAAKVEALAASTTLRAADPRVKQVMVNLGGSVDTVLVARSDGVLASDVRPLVRMNVQVIVEHNGRRESGYAGFGGRHSYAELLADGRPEKFAREALAPGAGQPRRHRRARRRDAGGARFRLAGRAAARSGGPRHGGRFQPQGHLDLRRAHGPARVASPGVTIVDDGTLAGRRGSLNVDDEGTPDAVHDVDRGRRAGRLHAGHAQRAADGRRTHRQRPARIVRAPGDAAHDQHLRAPAATIRRR